MLATFLDLPFHCAEADKTQIVDQAPAPALDSAEIVEANSNPAEAVDMETTPSPPSTPATPNHVSDDEEATARRHACKERDARQSLALSESDFPPLKTSTRRKKTREAEMLRDSSDEDANNASLEITDNEDEDTEVYIMSDERRREFEIIAIQAAEQAVSKLFSGRDESESGKET